MEPRKVGVAPAPKPIVVERVAVSEGRLSILVRMAPNAPRNVESQLLQAALAKYPSLPFHACVNDKGSAFADVMCETSVPHLLEHLIIDEQVRDERTPQNAVLVGTTEWLDERKGRARIEVNFTDDLVALRALREAVAFVNEGMVRS